VDILFAACGDAVSKSVMENARYGALAKPDTLYIVFAGTLSRRRQEEKK
jgi:hypothetical protein